MPTADYSPYHQPPATGADGTKLDNFIDAVQATVNGLDGNNFAASAALSILSLAASGGVTLSSGFLTLTPGANLDITSAAITPTASFHTLTTSSGTNLSTINSGVSGRLLLLRNGTGGNITLLVSSNILTTTGAGLVVAANRVSGFVYDLPTTKWVQLF